MGTAPDIADLESGEFERRRAGARQRGTPAWLWPEVAPEDWTRALGDIRQAIALVLAGRPADLSSSDRLALSVACYTSGMGPLLGWWVETGQLSAPPEIAALLAVHLEHARARESRIRGKAQQIVSALTARGIPVIVLKGGDTAHRYFPAPETRPASDLDLLVPFDWSRAAANVLAGEGLSCVERGALQMTWTDPGEGREPKSLWLAHADDPWSVDLHSALDFAATPGADIVRLDRAKPFDSVEPWAVEPSARVLSQPLLLLHLAVHAGGGLGSLTLLRMVEIILVIRQDLAGDRLDWADFLAAAAQTGALGAAYPALTMCDMLAPGTIPEDVVDACGEAMPRRARAVVDRLEPAIAHRVERASLSEHFMWVTGPGGWVRQLVSDLLPGGGALRRAYQSRFYRLLRGRITR
jgi:hypothetical protein